MGKINVILLKDVKGRGKAGEIVSVPDGYARNYLLPQHLAVIADVAAMQELKNKKESDARRQKEEMNAAEGIKKTIDEQSVDIYAKGGAGGKLFGSITSQNVANALNEKFGISIDKRKIKNSSLGGAKIVDYFGTYAYEIKLHKDIVANIRVNVKEEI